ncbi:MAG: hypothetical protein ISN29_11080, partial [Gammaproteobacteria bacterium AqS3]|nr:hypothetical protein [Gammaproteobacteria bacterium AqS3]
MNRSGKYKTSIKPALILAGLALLLGSLQAAGQPTEVSVYKKGSIVPGGIHTGDIRFNTRLKERPAGNVFVTMSSRDAVDTTISPNQLVFTTDNWSTFQTITVTVGPNAGGSCSNCEEMFNFRRVAVFPGNPKPEVSDYKVWVRDVDAAASLILSKTEMNLPELGGGEFKVRLRARPSTSVTVTVSSADSLLTSVSPSSLTFTRDNWDDEQTVSIRTGEAPGTGDVNATVSLSAGGGNYNNVQSSVSITVDGNSQAGLTLSASSLQVREGGDATFTVRLAAQPRDAVLVELDRSDPNAVRLSTEALNFFVNTPPAGSNFGTRWDVAQTVTVTGLGDGDSDDETLTINLSARGLGSGYGGVSGVISVTVLDRDRDQFVTSTQSLQVQEGSSRIFTVRMQSQPSASRSISVQSADTGAVTAIPATLNFTTANWNQPQPVTVHGIQDSDAVNERVDVNLAVVGGGHTASVSVSVTDDDAPSLSISPTSLTLTEGERGSFSLSLDSQPTQSVSVALTQPSNTDVKILGSTELTFTTANWNRGQSVSVVTEEDVDIEDESVSIGFTASGGDYEGVTGSIAVTVTDDDRIEMIVSPGTLSLDEGESDDFTVRLQSAPNGDIQVIVYSSDDGAASASPATLDFTTSDWSTDKTVTVTAVDDGDVSAETATIHLLAVGAGTGTGSVAVNVADDDERGLTVSSRSVPVVEERTATFTVKLDSQPSSNVTVSVTSDSTQTATASPASLIFTASNWSQTQTVTVTGVADSNAENDSAKITLSASGGGYDGLSVEVAVTVADNDQKLLDLSVQRLDVNEGGSKTFTVRLTTLPTGNVSVAVAETSNADVTATPTPLTFTTTDWNSPQTVTVTAGEDSDGSDDTASVTLTASGADYAGVSGAVAVNVTDNDRGLTIVAASDPLSVDEGGNNTFTVRLTTRPTGSVRVAVAETSNADVSASPASLTFTTTDWNSPQTVTVTATEDNDGSDDTASVTLTASGADYADVSDSVAVSVTDNDRGLTIVAASDPLTVDEGGSNTFTVRLTTRPTGNVRVAVAETSNADVTATPTPLTFTTTDWNATQTVTVTAAEDDDGSDDTASVTLTASGADYADVSDSVAVSVIDNDRGLTIVSASDPLTVDEGGNNTFTVRLKSLPTGSVRVAVAETSNADVTATPTSLTFTTADWNSPQTVTVRAAEDDDGVDDTASVTLTASG